MFFNKGLFFMIIWLWLGGCGVYILGQAIFHEVPVQVTDPLDVYGHHPPADWELGVVPPGGPDHVPQLEDVAEPGVRLREIVDTNLVWHVVPVVPAQYKIHTNITQISLTQNKKGDYQMMNYDISPRGHTFFFTNYNKCLKCLIKIPFILLP